MKVFGLWNHEPARALEESAKTKKPFLIDFYGIGCPPCNQYDESVFPAAEFKKVDSKYVLLKPRTAPRFKFAQIVT